MFFLLFNFNFGFGGGGNRIHAVKPGALRSGFGHQIYRVQVVKLIFEAPQPMQVGVKDG